MRGVGIDIAHIPRFAAALSRWGAARLCARILHPQEVCDFQAKCQSNQAQFLASRYVAKSCIIRCCLTQPCFTQMGRQGSCHQSNRYVQPCSHIAMRAPAAHSFPELPLSPRHISVIKLASGSPRATLHHCAAAAWWSKRGASASQRPGDGTAPVVMLSLTHDGEYAAAIAFDE